MSNDIQKSGKYQVTETKYGGGTNFVVTNNETGKSASVAVTDYGLIDVQTDDGKYAYTGNSGSDAHKAVKDHVG
jgi:flagellar basal body rod protein FlgF